MSRIYRFALRFLVSTLFVAAFFVVTQDVQIFPGIVKGLFLGAPVVPKWASEHRVLTADGESLLVWSVSGKPLRRKQVALVFHGNADSLTSTTQVQRWLASLGFTSYALEYRGYPGSTGFPSEHGIYLDSEAAMELVLAEEKVAPADVVIFGHSIGTGPAAYVAQKYSVGALVITAPYTSLVEVVKDMPLIGYLHQFLWYEFPTVKFIANLKNTCVIDAHGRLDSTIAYHHSEDLKQVYKGSCSYKLITSDSAGHNDILGAAAKEIERGLDELLPFFK